MRLTFLPASQPQINHKIPSRLEVRQDVMLFNHMCADQNVEGSIFNDIEPRSLDRSGIVETPAQFHPLLELKDAVDRQAFSGLRILEFSFEVAGFEDFIGNNVELAPGVNLDLDWMPDHSRLVVREADVSNLVVGVAESLPQGRPCCLVFDLTGIGRQLGVSGVSAVDLLFAFVTYDTSLQIRVVVFSGAVGLASVCPVPKTIQMALSCISW